MSIKLEEQLYAIESASEASMTLETLSMTTGITKEFIQESGAKYDELKEQLEEQRAIKEDLDSLFVESGLGMDEINELAGELDKLELADSKEIERASNELQKEDASKVDAELALWEEKFKALKAKESVEQEEEHTVQQKLQQRLMA